MTTISGNRQAARQGEPWTMEDDERLAELLGGDDGLDAVADRLGRSVSAVRGRARRMLPDDPAVPAGPAAIDWLRSQLRKGFDWRRVLEELRRPPQAYQSWNQDEVERLITAVRAGGSWREIARAHGRTEPAILRRLSDLLAPDVGHHRPDRARADALRTLLAADPEVPWAEAIRPRAHVLVGWDGGTVAHVSLHPDEATAIVTRDTHTAGGTLTWVLTDCPLAWTLTR